MHFIAKVVQKPYFYAAMIRDNNGETMGRGGERVRESGRATLYTFDLQLVVLSSLRGDERPPLLLRIQPCSCDDDLRALSSSAAPQLLDDLPPVGTFQAGRSLQE